MGLPCPGQQEVDVPGIDADSAFAVTFKHDEKLEDSQPCCVQCALLYTTCAGTRAIADHSLLRSPLAAARRLRSLAVDTAR